MAVEYDLAILGGTPEGCEAAAHAAQYGARVALVLQDQDGARSRLYRRGLLHMTVDEPWLQPPPDSPRSPWQWAQQRAHLIAETLTRETVQQLTVQGVDVIAEVGKLIRDRPLTVATPSRQFTTRGVLIAIGNQVFPPDLAGLAQVDYDTPDLLLQREHLPSSVILWGSSPQGIAVAQWLTQWQVQVMLATPDAALLSQADEDVSRWVTAQLRAQGVDVRLGATALAVSQLEGAIALQLPDEVITAAGLVVAAAPQPNLQDLGLEQCLPDARRLRVNAFLQTEHPRIYACGAAIGGYELPAIARQEAHHAAHNALFWNRRRIDYSTLPYDLPTRPAMVQVGLTTAQAYQRFGKESVLVARQSLDDLPQAQWRAATAGFCKLVAHRNGRILGCQAVGPEAQEWVQTIAVLMAQKIPWWRLVNAATLPHSLTEVLRQTVAHWERDRWRPGRWRRDWAENWCNWRRSR